MSRFERRLYVVLVAVVLVWPGVRKQFFLQIRQITHTTDVRVSSWPVFTTSYEERLPVPMTKLQKVAEKNGLWEGLAELQAAEGRYGGPAVDVTQVIRSFDKALAADRQSKVVYARSLSQRLRQVDFYRPEEREIDEKRLGRRQPPYPSGVSMKDAKPPLDLALAGQKLDPENSYYDYALAYIYIGMGKDEDAVASMNRAWRKPECNTYWKEASLSARELLMEAGVPSLEATLNPVSSFSQLARMRRLAQNLKVIAQKAEANGDWERGWELRLAAFRIGNQLIRGGQEYMTPLVGVAIQILATGSLPRTPEQAEQLRRAGQDREAQAKITVQILRDYVAQHHLGAEGNWVISQYAAGQELRRLNRELLEKESGLYYHHQLSKLLWYGAASALAELLILLAILAILSLPRAIRTAQGDRFAKIVGATGAALTAAGLFTVAYYALRAWSSMETPITAGVTWKLIGILPALMIVCAIVSLIRRGPKNALVALRTSARYALPVIAVIYVILSGFLGVERGDLERHALQSIEHGLDPQQIEILKKTGFRR